MRNIELKAWYPDLIKAEQICNVRIHLDLVERLGTFLEFEAVMSDEMRAEEGVMQIDHLREVIRSIPDCFLFFLLYPFQNPHSCKRLMV
ncbi:MAG: hypothetical protein HY731_07925 [Candidatus Tectomicrobia bacterium]|nr:hypothetical protein [Candidatus Tectomicrobia bacterium]